MERYRILVADQNPSFLKKTGEILEEVGGLMIPVSNGAKALTICQHDLPDMALMHINIPSLTGAEVCHRIKTQIEPCLPVVLMFSEEGERIASTVEHSLADNYIIRPIKRTELLFCFRYMIQLRRLLKDQVAYHRLSQHPGEARPSMVSLDMFHTFLDLEIRRVERYRFPLTLLSVCVDPLPEEAGAWGRVLENQLGKALARAIRACVRLADISTIISNREVLVLMPHTDRRGAITVGNRICRTVAGQSYHFGRSRIQPTASVGIAYILGDHISPGDMIAKAKSYRSRAEESGGNQIFAG